MINYTGKIFADSGSKLPPNESAVVVGVIQLIGTYVSTLFVDRVGRKVIIAHVIAKIDAKSSYSSSAVIVLAVVHRNRSESCGIGHLYLL